MAIARNGRRRSSNFPTSSARSAVPWSSNVPQSNRSRRNGRREQRDAGLDKAARRLAVQLDSWREQERTYSAYARALSKLLTLEPDDFDRHRLSAEDLIPKRAMGDPNSVYDLENYVAGPAAGGLVLAPDGSLDFARSFERINYPPLLASLSVRNNVQAAVGSHPVDFLADDPQKPISASATRFHLALRQRGQTGA